ncbi:hypothetical protein KP509_03G063100 [Ceratopteris richardii]|uniref:Uncharacterized protein n=1 Tax=Ceratopteris richardii TaxID=49495 RepID=A0A8T2V3H3_CERRI|nr:hypothetical protein KP509_03G063100 [Ceratopteris richardii]
MVCTKPAYTHIHTLWRYTDTHFMEAIWILDTEYDKQVTDSCRLHTAMQTAMVPSSQIKYATAVRMYVFDRINTVHDALKLSGKTVCIRICLMPRTYMPVDAVHDVIKRDGETTAP